MNQALAGKLEFGNMEQIKAIREMEKEARRKALTACFPEKALPECPEQNRSMECHTCGQDVDIDDHDVMVWEADDEKVRFYCRAEYPNGEKFDCLDIEKRWDELRLSEAEVAMINSRCGLSIACLR